MPMDVQDLGCERAPGVPDDCIEMRHRFFQGAVIEGAALDRREGRQRRRLGLVLVVDALMARAARPAARVGAIGRPGHGTQRRKPGQPEKSPLGTMRHFDRDLRRTKLVEDAGRVLDCNAEDVGERCCGDHAGGREHVHGRDGLRGLPTVADRASGLEPGPLQGERQIEAIGRLALQGP